MPYHSFLLLDKKHSDRAGKYKCCTAEAEIGTFSAGVPLDVGLAEQIDTHQRNTEVNCLCPYIEHLQDRQYDYQKGNDYGHYCDDLMC